MKIIKPGVISKPWVGKLIRCSHCGFEGIMEELDCVHTSSQRRPESVLEMSIHCPTVGCDQIIQFR
jgi:hypothetical protein